MKNLSIANGCNLAEGDAPGRRPNCLLPFTLGFVLVSMGPALGGNPGPSLGISPLPNGAMQLLVRDAAVGQTNRLQVTEY
jgi:hypothetical protein